MVRTKQTARATKVSPAKKIAAGKKAAVKAKKSPVKTTQEVCRQTVISPKNRCIVVGGRTYKKYEKAGLISNGKVITSVVKDVVIAQKSPAKLLEKKYKEKNAVKAKKSPNKAKKVKTPKKSPNKSPAKKAKRSPSKQVVAKKSPKQHLKM